jgi:hypothetical protein
VQASLLVGHDCHHANSIDVFVHPEVDVCAAGTRRLEASCGGSQRTHTTPMRSSSRRTVLRRLSSGSPTSTVLTAAAQTLLEHPEEWQQP